MREAPPLTIRFMLMQWVLIFTLTYLIFLGLLFLLTGEAPLALAAGITIAALAFQKFVLTFADLLSVKRPPS